jgi:flavin-dependent dehydrogenase
VAGFFTALLLAQKGLRVRVIEAADRLDPAPRTLIVTSRARDLLGAVGENAVVNEIHRFELFTDGRVATVPLRRPDLIIERSRLVRSLAQQAEAAGAQVLLRRRFLSLEADGNGLSFLTERGRGGITEEGWTRRLVGADGTFSAVARSAGWTKPPTVSLIQAIVRLPGGTPPDATRVWFIPADTPYFYWLIPESPTRGVVGLIGEDGQKIRSCLERFMERQGLEPIVFQGARIPVYTGWVPVHRQVGNGDVYLVGDAASQVKVTTVGGIVTGFRGSLGVAEAILKGGANRELRALRRELDLHLLIRRTLHHFKQADYSRLLDLLGPTTRRSLSLYTRDEASKILWRLCVRQPRLLLLGIRALLTSSPFPFRNPL